MIVIPNASAATLLQIVLNKDAAEELDIKVYKNDVTPTYATALADFTEADFTGYAAVQLDSANYTVTVGAGDGDPATGAYAAVAFTSTADQTSQDCYGYYVVRRTTGDLLFCERFSDGPYSITNNGDGFNISQNIQLS